MNRLICVFKISIFSFLLIWWDSGCSNVDDRDHDIVCRTGIRQYRRHDVFRIHEVGGSCCRWDTCIQCCRHFCSFWERQLFFSQWQKGHYDYSSTVRQRRHGNIKDICDKAMGREKVHTLGLTTRATFLSLEWMMYVILIETGLALDTKVNMSQEAREGITSIIVFSYLQDDLFVLGRSFENDLVV